MYKKIKNGSFMNWIWFIIAIMPILLVIIWTFGNLFVENKSVKLDNMLNYNEQFQEEYIENDIRYKRYYNPYLKSNYYLTNYSDNQLITNNYIEFEIYKQEITNETIYLWFDNQFNEKIYLYIYIDAYTYDINNDYLMYETASGDNKLEPNKLYEIYYDIEANDGYPLISCNIDVNAVVGNLKIFMSREKIDKSVFNGLNDWSYVEILDNKLIFYNYLQSINNTLKTNGFISSAFLNLAQLFGVNNVYYSLACYYIEYLLVIALLHLAFDVLYMLPNICHKFMEKIGGERD